MGRLKSTVTIARPVADVFKYLLDLDEHPGDPTVESVEKTPDGPTTSGTTFRFRHSKGPKETSMEFTSVETDRKIEFRGSVGPLRPAGSFDFAPADGGTRLSVDLVANPVGPMKVLSPLVDRMGQRIWDKRLSSIKAALERPSS